MADRETNLLNAYESTLSVEMSSVASSMTITDVTDLDDPFYLVIEPDSGTQREYVYVSVLTGSVATVPERYLAGSAATSGLTHPVGSVVRTAAMSQHVTDINDRVDAVGTHAGLTGVTTDQHHTEDHAARHADGGADELDGDDLASTGAVVDSVLTADGAGAATWEDRTGFKFSQTIYKTVDGTFDKADFAGLRMIRVRVQGAGGGGGGCELTSAGQTAAAAGAGGGGYSETEIAVAALSASETVTVGTGGAGGAAGPNNGVNGEDSSFGTHAVAGGGELGRGSGAAIGDQPGNVPGNGGAGTAGDLQVNGGAGEPGLAFTTANRAWGGTGGDSQLGGGSRGGNALSAVGGNGITGLNYGGGGSGAANRASQPVRLGGNGAPGIVIIDLYH